jgi:hypothetical protein
MDSRGKSMTITKTTNTLNHFVRSLTKQSFIPLIVFSLLLTSQVVFAQKATIKQALNDAGIKNLPSFIIVSDNDIGLHFPAKFGGHKLTFTGSVDADALKDKKFVFTSSEKGKIDWNNAFGMSMLELSELGLSLTIDSDDIAVALSGKLGGVFKKKNDNIDVNIDIAVEDKEISDFTLALTGHRFSLADFKEFKRIPDVKHFAIESPVISLDTIGGTIDILKKKVDAVVFYDHENKGWNIGLKFEKALTLADITGIHKNFLKDIGLPKMRMINSTEGLSGAYDDLPLAVQNFFTVDGSLPDDDLDLGQGMSLMAEFNVAQAPKDVQKALAKIGLGKAQLDVDGEIENLFSSKPSVEINVDMDAPSDHGFKFLKLKDEKVEFFMSLSENQAGLGFKTAVKMKQHKGNDLEFDVDFGLKENDTEVEVFVSGDMKGDWKNAMGIKNLVIENTSLSAGINETGSFDLSLEGTVNMGSESVTAAADMVLSPEALGLPTAIALAGTANKLSFNNLIKDANKRAKPKGGGFKPMSVALKDLDFAFMTPGASLPEDLADELDIQGAGIALQATLLFDKKELGSAKGYASTDGLSLNGTLDPFKFGPLDLKDAELTVQAGPEVDAKFYMAGDIELFKNFEEKYVIDIEPKQVILSSDTRFGGAFDAALTVKSTGQHLSAGSDLDFDAKLATKYDKIFRSLVNTALKGLKKGDKDISSAQHTLDVKQKDVNGLNKKIHDAKAKAKKNFDAASKTIKHDEDKVNSLKKTIDYNNKEAKKYSHDAKKDAKHWKFAKAAKDGVKAGEHKSAAGAEEVSLKTAEGVLKEADKAVKIVPVDADPTVVKLEAELVSATAGLQTAKGVLTAAHATNKGLEKALKAVANGLTALKINSLEAKGSLKGLITAGKEGDAPTLIVDVDIHGKHHVYKENLEVLEKGFNELAKDIADDVAKELLKVFKG